MLHVVGAQGSICFNLVKSNWVLHFGSEDFAGMAGLKSYLWAFAKTHPQNELGDMISEPYAKFNRSGVINQIGFFIFVQKVV